MTRDNPQLPEGFVFGTSSASYQIEGAAGEDRRGPQPLGRHGELCLHRDRVREVLRHLLLGQVSVIRMAVTANKQEPGWRMSLTVLALGVLGLVLGCVVAASLPPGSLGAVLAALAAVAAIVPGLFMTFVSASSALRRE